MNNDQIDNIVKSQVGTAWNTRNLHGVDLRKSLVTPELISVIDRKVRGGKIQDHVIPVWRVLVEDPISQTGYRIVADQSGTIFGLAVKGFPSDELLVLIGWYGNFLTTFQSM